MTIEELYTAFQKQVEVSRALARLSGTAFELVNTLLLSLIENLDCSKTFVPGETDVMTFIKAQLLLAIKRQDATAVNNILEVVLLMSIVLTPDIVDKVEPDWKSVPVPEILLPVRVNKEDLKLVAEDKEGTVVLVPALYAAVLYACTVAMAGAAPAAAPAVSEPTAIIKAFLAYGYTPAVRASELGEDPVHFAALRGSREESVGVISQLLHVVPGEVALTRMSREDDLTALLQRVSDDFEHSQRVEQRPSIAATHMSRHAKGRSLAKCIASFQHVRGYRVAQDQELRVRGSKIVLPGLFLHTVRTPQGKEIRGIYDAAGRNLLHCALMQATLPVCNMLFGFLEGIERYRRPDSDTLTFKEFSQYFPGVHTGTSPTQAMRVQQVFGRYFTQSMNALDQHGYTPVMALIASNMPESTVLERVRQSFLQPFVIDPRRTDAAAGAGGAAWGAGPARLLVTPDLVRKQELIQNKQAVLMNWVEVKGVSYNVTAYALAQGRVLLALWLTARGSLPMAYDRVKGRWFIPAPLKRAGTMLERTAKSLEQYCGAVAVIGGLFSYLLNQQEERGVSDKKGDREELSIRYDEARDILSALCQRYESIALRASPSSLDCLTEAEIGECQAASRSYLPSVIGAKSLPDLEAQLSTPFVGRKKLGFWVEGKSGDYQALREAWVRWLREVSTLPVAVSAAAATGAGVGSSAARVVVTDDFAWVVGVLLHGLNSIFAWAKDPKRRGDSLANSISAILTRWASPSAVATEATESSPTPR